MNRLSLIVSCSFLVNQLTEYEKNICGSKWEREGQCGLGLP